jgi:hypothetical protein
MQKLYASFLVLAAVISIVSGACLVILLIASNPPESGSVAVATGIVIIPFVISAFVLRAASNSHLCIPCSKNNARNRRGRGHRGGVVMVRGRLRALASCAIKAGRRDLHRQAKSKVHPC